MGNSKAQKEFTNANKTLKAAAKNYADLAKLCRNPETIKALEALRTAAESM